MSGFVTQIVERSFEGLSISESSLHALESKLVLKMQKLSSTCLLFEVLVMMTASGEHLRTSKSVDHSDSTFLP
jgi:hypothetical protein